MVMRLAILAGVLLAGSLCAAETPAITAEPIAAPTTANATGASLVAGLDGVAWLTWLERDGPTTLLRFATLDAGARSWSTAQTIASGADWFVNSADFPALTVGPAGRATAVWYVNNLPAPETGSAAHAHHRPGYRAFASQTTDGGKTWSAGTALTRESDSVEFVSLATLADGRVLAAWLDGRAKKSGGKAQQLFSRIVGDSASDTLIDGSACDCCQTALTAFPDGTALLSYRGRTRDEVRDVRVTRLRGGRWDESRPVHQDGWKIAGCPVNGPQLASDGGRVAAAWFTAADNNPRVIAALSPDAGDRFLMPVRISDAKASGRVATVLLHDGAILVTWVDADGGLWLRRVSPDFTLSDPLRLTAPENGRIKGFPRLALWRDYTGGKISAQLLVAFVRENDPGLGTLLVTVPEGDLLEAEKSCDCAPTAEELQGFPIRGTIDPAVTTEGTVRVRHFEVPGIFDEGVRDFQIPPDSVANATQAGRQFLGRIERREGSWWLFNVRLIASPPQRR